MSVTGSGRQVSARRMWLPRSHRTMPRHQPPQRREHLRRRPSWRPRRKSTPRTWTSWTSWRCWRGFAVRTLYLQCAHGRCCWGDPLRYVSPKLVLDHTMPCLNRVVCACCGVVAAAVACVVCALTAMPGRYRRRPSWPRDAGISPTSGHQAALRRHVLHNQHRQEPVLDQWQGRRSRASVANVVGARSRDEPS